MPPSFQRPQTIRFRERSNTLRQGAATIQDLAIQDYVALLESCGLLLRITPYQLDLYLKIGLLSEKAIPSNIGEGV